MENLTETQKQNDDKFNFIDISNIIENDKQIEEIELHNALMKKNLPINVLDIIEKLRSDFKKNELDFYVSTHGSSQTRIAIKAHSDSFNALLIDFKENYINYVFDTRSVSKLVGYKFGDYLGFPKKYNNLKDYLNSEYAQKKLGEIYFEYKQHIANQ